MVIVDCALLLCGFALCIFTAHSDATRGIVENRLMLVGFTAAVILDACAYILIAPWLGITFLTNAVIAIVVSIFLYMANVWAGGDCKLFVVLSLLLPAADYLMIGECLLGSIPILIVAFILGYVQIVWMGLHATVKQGAYFLATDVCGAFFTRASLLADLSITDELAAFPLSAYCSDVVYAVSVYHGSF